MSTWASRLALCFRRASMNPRGSREVSEQNSSRRRTGASTFKCASSCDGRWLRRPALQTAHSRHLENRRDATDLGDFSAHDHGDGFREWAPDDIELLIGVVRNGGG